MSSHYLHPCLGYLILFSLCVYVLNLLSGHSNKSNKVLTWRFHSNVRESWHWIYRAPGSMSSSYEPSHYIFTTIFQNKYYYSHFGAEKTEFWDLRFMELVSDNMVKVYTLYIMLLFHVGLNLFLRIMANLLATYNMLVTF